MRLMEEANEEAEHKGWCDTELSTNEQTRKEKTSAVETLHAEIDELTASIAKATQVPTFICRQRQRRDSARCGSLIWVGPFAGCMSWRRFSYATSILCGGNHGPHGRDCGHRQGCGRGQRGLSLL